MTLAIAIVALGLAGYAVFVTRKINAALAVFMDMDDAEEEAPESAELWVSDGDLHTQDAAALYEATGAIALCVSEGVPCAVVKGQGVVSLHKLLSESAKIRPIKG